MLYLKSLGMKRTSCQLNDVFAVLAQTAVKLPSRGQDAVVAIAVAAIALGTSSKSVGDSAIVIGSSAMTQVTGAVVMVSHASATGELLQCAGTLA